MIPSRNLLYSLVVVGWASTLGVVGVIHPIILVPGDGGSQLEAKLDKPSVVHYLCTKKTDDYYNIWLNMELLVPVIIDCFIDNVRLVYNFTSRTTDNSPGVSIRVPGFGNTTSVEYLDPSQRSPGLYFNRIVEHSLMPLGYIRDNDIRGAPYDFRKAPNELKEWMLDFKSLVEDSYTRGGNVSVILISHSMGGPIALYLMHQMKQSWKDKYVRAIITLAAPWGGSVKAWKVFAAGDDLGVYVLPSHTMRGMQRTSPSTSFLLPSKLFWKKDEVLVSCPGKGNYTVNDYAKFFRDMNFPEGESMHNDTKDLMGNLEPPGVEIHCLHGQGVSTVDSMLYKEEKYFPDSPTLAFGNGDGTVNIRSLRGCLRWSKPKKVYNIMKPNPKKRLVLKKHRNGNKSWDWTLVESSKTKKPPPVYHQEFSGVDHMEILRADGVIAYVKNAVEKINAAS